MRIARIVFAIAACVPALGQTLTTIQDTLFKADGTRFSGSLTIHWTTFDAANLGTVVQQSRSVTVVNGNLQVQLAPNANATAPANVYTVFYQSDGRNQFAETWTVPVSTTALKVAAVRTGTLASTGGSGGGTGSGAQTPILETDVTGLVNDLEQRPVKGSGYGTGRAAVINQNGEVETVVGDVSDCVHVDGTSGPCNSTPQFFDAETPGGTVDGSNATFTLANAPSGNSMLLFRNGLYMTPSFDYTLTGNTLTFVTADIPQPGDTLTASYRIDPGAPANVAALNAAGNRVVISAAQVLCSATGTSVLTNTFTSLGSCTIPVSQIRPGDRIELQFTLSHSGTASQFDVKTLFGTTALIQRHGSTQDSAIIGRVSAAVSSSGITASTESYGTVLTLQPTILTIASPTAAVKLDIQAQLSKAGTADRLTLQNYTVLRYPGN